MPKAPVLIADRFRQALRSRGTRPCVPGRANRSMPIRHGKELYRQRHEVEIMFGRLKDWRRIAGRYDRCAHTFTSAIALATSMLFWLLRNKS